MPRDQCTFIFITQINSPRKSVECEHFDTYLLNMYAYVPGDQTKLTPPLKGSLYKKGYKASIGYMKKIENTQKNLLK